MIVLTGFTSVLVQMSSVSRSGGLLGTSLALRSSAAASRRSFRNELGQLPTVEAVREHVLRALQSRAGQQFGALKGDLCWGPGSCRSDFWCDEEKWRCVQKCRGEFGFCPGNYIRSEDGIDCVQPRWWIRNESTLRRADWTPSIVFMSIPRRIDQAPYNVTQRNAIASWKAQQSSMPHIVLLGNERGVRTRRTRPALRARSRTHRMQRARKHAH